MNATAALLLGIVIGAALGALAAALVLRSRRGAHVGASNPELVRARHETELAQLQQAETRKQSELREALASLSATASGLQKQLADQQRQFAEVSDRQREEQHAQLERERAESKVLRALAPVSAGLDAMQQKVAELETQRMRQHGELSQQLRFATESEERLRSTAESLAAALRSNSTRGVWGETQLRSVVEAAGLLERVDFDVQSSIVSDAGSGRPDMIIRLPGGKSIAVDAKAPFNAYLEASSIPVAAMGAEGAQRASLMRQHVKAVREHITALGGKSYWSGLDASPEMVIAFIPSESLVSSAMEADPTIMEFAFSKRVALASPVTLWSVLKTVAFSWQQDVLTNDAKTLFDLSRELYSRLSTTATHIEKLGRSLERSVKDYNGFVGSLERQVLPTARKLNRLDESKVIGGLNAIEETPRRLAAYELVAGSGPDESGPAESRPDESRPAELRPGKPEPAERQVGEPV